MAASAAIRRPGHLRVIVKLSLSSIVRIIVFSRLDAASTSFLDHGKGRTLR
jgi:hypothetical protein